MAGLTDTEIYPFISPVLNVDLVFCHTETEIYPFISPMLNVDLFSAILTEKAHKQDFYRRRITLGCQLIPAQVLDPLK